MGPLHQKQREIDHLQELKEEREAHDMELRLQEDEHAELLEEEVEKARTRPTLLNRYGQPGLR